MTVYMVQDYEPTNSEYIFHALFKTRKLAQLYVNKYKLKNACAYQYMSIKPVKVRDGHRKTVLFL